MPLKLELGIRCQRQTKLQPPSIDSSTISPCFVSLGGNHVISQPSKSPQKASNLPQYGIFQSSLESKQFWVRLHSCEQKENSFNWEKEIWLTVCGHNFFCVCFRSPPRRKYCIQDNSFDSVGVAQAVVFSLCSYFFF